MKTKIVALLCLVMGFYACNKDSELPDSPKIELNGEVYEAEYLKRGVSRLFNIPIDQLYFDETNGVFRHTYFNLTLSPSDFIEDLKILEKDGYDF